MLKRITRLRTRSPSGCTVSIRPAFHWRGFGPHGWVKEWCAETAHHSLTRPCGHNRVNGKPALLWFYLRFPGQWRLQNVTFLVLALLVLVVSVLAWTPLIKISQNEKHLHLLSHIKRHLKSVRTYCQITHIAGKIHKFPVYGEHLGNCCSPNRTVWRRKSLSMWFC